MLAKIILNLTAIFITTTNLPASITVAGEVNKPTSIQLTKGQKITLKQALEKAGGKTPFSSFIYVVRETETNFVIHSFRTKLITAGIHEEFDLINNDYIWSQASSTFTLKKTALDYLPPKKQKEIKESKKALSFISWPKKRAYQYQKKE